MIFFRFFEKINISLPSKNVIGQDFKNSNINGKDLNPLLNAGYDGTIENRELYWHYPHYHGDGWTPRAAIISGNLKLIHFYETVHLELYILSEDPSELNSLNDHYPDKAKKLAEKLAQWQQSVGAEMPMKRSNK